MELLNQNELLHGAGSLCDDLRRLIECIASVITATNESFIELFETIRNASNVWRAVSLGFNWNCKA